MCPTALSSLVAERPDLAATAKLLIADDVQRPANRILLETRYLPYEPHSGAANVIALAASEQAMRTLASIGSEAGFGLITSPQVADLLG